ncbi:hypothetical protein CALVIDRAFT_596763 [Calocera viscosa TUFC12733]|uniref:Uncharacterized protein n=1 Tax=Calocera viscosa (strain TUFC12733) TaxID=1330018 RepID=A0A167PDU0_CALVF|nr:hypothetical protein CALVIDRAFT_596763 [Calocera viscosa TUFC12733]
MVYSSTERPNGFHPRPSLSSQILPLLASRLPLELAWYILNLASLHSRTWVRRLENVSSKPATNLLEFKHGVRTYLDSPPIGPRKLRKVLVNVTLAPWRDIWPKASGPSMLRASLVRPVPKEEREKLGCNELIVREEPIDPPWTDTRTSFSVVMDDGWLIGKAQTGDRIRVSLLPHYRTRSGAVPVVKEVTMYLYCDW